MLPVHVIIVAGGSGTRFGSALPKQFLEVAGRPVLLRAVEAMAHALPEAALTVVIAREREECFRSMCERCGVAVPVVAYGGATRWESVSRGLATVAADTPIVLVHDGARPFPSIETVQKLVYAVESGAQGAVPAVPVTDSLRRTVDGGRTSTAVNRAELRAVQTPQAFRADLLRRAYAEPYRDSFTDDASVMEAAGFSDIVMTPGSPSNIKVTHPMDMAVAEALVASGAV